VGVAYCKTAAKTASEEKKPDGYFEIRTPEDFVELMIDRDVKSLYTVGAKTAEKLNRLGYDCGKADGDYGMQTFRAVVAFQEDHQLEADGIAGRMTMAAIEEALSDKKDPAPPAAAPDPDAQPSEFWLPDLQLGDKDPAVTLLQAALNIRGFDCGSPDGIFGPKTQAALNRFKESRKMEQNGIADRETWNKILGVIA
jgi:peptidoglycan hydrolase-like protein with peptidoglycan-binding domain